MPRGTPLDGAPGWRVIERPPPKPQLARYRAGYMALAVLAVLFLAFVLVHRFSAGWPADQREKIAQALTLPTVETAEPETAAPVGVDPIAPAPQAVPPPQASPEPRVGATLEPDSSERVHAADDSPAEAGAPAPPRASSPAAPIRVFIHYPADQDDALPAIQLAAQLQVRNFDVVDIRLVDIAIERPSVRYFFERDRTESRRLVEVIGAVSADRAPDQATDFRHFSPRPRPGTVELWLPAAGRNSSGSSS